MESITIGQIALAITFIVSLVSGCAYLKKVFEKVIKSSIKSEMDGIRTQIDDVQKRLDSVDMNHTKNFLVRFLAQVERGDPVDEVEKERFLEQLDHYISHNGNSYIRRKVEKLTEEGKL